MSNTGQSKILKVLNGEALSIPPIWMMRQAGRHLPEYLELRNRAQDFMNFCYSPSLATEATLQPIRRYDMDGAILFADILLVLDGMGFSVRFEKGIGPIVTGYDDPVLLKGVKIEKALQRVSPIFETVARVRQQLDPDKSLIGFCGAPWTVALYAVEGRGGTDKSAIRTLAYKNPIKLNALLDIIIEVSAQYLAAQVKAGADALMLFESWAEGLPNNIFHQFISGPNKRLIDRVRDLGITVPIIAFPRGAGPSLPDFIQTVQPQGVGLDTAMDMDYAKSIIPENMAIQGHLDPLLLIAGGSALDQRVDELVSAYADRPHIFNLGHGVRPETPIAHVEQVVARVRGQNQ